ncbi:M20 family metallo-hydrolase [Alteromonas lipolytica]|uniref:Zn-dependent hydrolase n=1 Tax=Alteromonas lipolytica TaxID=1856405 RepID=A0A1E8FIB2_9ALTE|nr:M20 family metallo-hydrolase [Alteromonas lipolytica]OFI35476.1 Zn-dependent hydrolase [Alteromonas lipolytica]GGF76572.1 Zn-dependent hydrolase [Alteromonas lipolytica]
MTALAVNGKRLWSSLMEMAEIGGTAKGGCNRQALTEEDKTGRELFIRWCEEIGCTLRVDQMGNLFLRMAGSDNSLPPVLMGSHLDTQPTGGKFDGVYGVLGGLEVLRTIYDAGITPKHPIEVAVWTNEEGARFSPAMIGSGVWCGEFDLAYGHARTDKQGVSIKQALESIGYLGTEPCQPFPVKAAFELHIEQGPILESIGKPIGVVKGVQGMRWYDLIIDGQPVHAGPTPMEQRRDPFMAQAAIVSELYALAATHSPWARATFGDIKAEPGSRNTVPARLTMAVDLRHPDQNILSEMDTKFREIAKKHCDKFGLTYEIKDEWNSPAVQFNSDCIDAVRDATEAQGYAYEEMFSGAGHDSVYTSRVIPTSMIFIPCEKGISHNEAENATPEDIEAGCNVLLGAVLKMANA